MESLQKFHCSLHHIIELLLVKTEFCPSCGDFGVLLNHISLNASGPKAADVLQTGIDIDLSKLKFMNGITASIFSIPSCRITRCGYTGEDGFEVGCQDSRS